MIKGGLICSALGLLLSTTGYAQCTKSSITGRLDRTALWQDINTLSSDEMQGRQTATPGAELARNYISARYQQIGLREFSVGKYPVSQPYVRHFKLQSGWSEVTGSNVLGWLAGSSNKQQFIVVTAHYDHLGKHGRTIFNGADDNASGVATMLSIANYMAAHTRQYSIIFVATDAEEKGLYGAKGFLAEPPVPLEVIILNLNLDMLAQGGKREKLYVTPSRDLVSWPKIRTQVITSADSCLVEGHRSRLRRRFQHQKVNWRKSSDHAAFGHKNIPYLFLGVSDHRYYHTENDTTAQINRDFFNYAAETALTLLLTYDQLTPGFTDSD